MEPAKPPHSYPVKPRPPAQEKPLYDRSGVDRRRPMQNGELLLSRSGNLDRRRGPDWSGPVRPVPTPASDAVSAPAHYTSGGIQPWEGPMRCVVASDMVPPPINWGDAASITRNGITTHKADVVQAPAHYTSGGIQPIDYIQANALDFCEGNVVKYVTRHRKKNGLEDLRKAQQYLRFEAKKVYGADL